MLYVTILRYLYIRGLHNREEVLQGRLAVLEFIMSEGEGKIDLKEQWEKGVLDLRCGGGCLPYMEVRYAVFYKDCGFIVANYSEEHS